MGDPVTEGVRITKAIDRISDIERTMDRVSDVERAMDKVADIERTMDRVSDVERTMDRVSDVERTMDRVSDVERTMDRVSDTERTIDAVTDAERTVDRVTDAGRTADKVTDAERTADRVTDAGRTADKIKDTENAVDMSQMATKADVSDLARYGRWMRHVKNFGREASMLNPLKGPAHLMAEAWRFKGMTALSFFAAHYVTDGKSTEAMASVMTSAANITADQIHDIWPEAAQFLRDAGPWLAQQGANLWALPKDAAITAGDTALIKEFGEEASLPHRIALRFAVGAPDKAVLLELGYDDKITTADIAKIGYDASQLPEGERKEYFINEFARQVGQTPEEVRANLEAHKEKLAFIPGIKEVMPEVQTAWEQFKEKHPEEAAAMDDALERTRDRTRTAMDSARDTFTNPKPDLDDMSKQSISSLFNLASNNLDTLGVGMFGKIVFNVLGFLSNIFGSSMQKWALEFIDIEDKFDKLVDAGKGNQLVAAVGDQFPEITGTQNTRTVDGPSNDGVTDPTRDGTTGAFTNAANGQSDTGQDQSADVEDPRKMPLPTPTPVTGG